MIRLVNTVKLLIGIACLAFPFSSHSMADSVKEWNVIYIPIRTIFIGPPGNTIPRKPLANFPHPVHFNYSCKTCHHTWDGYKRIRSCTASGCHGAIKVPGEDTAPGGELTSNIRNYKVAYHNMCLGCHRRIKVKNKQLAASRSIIGESVAAFGPTNCRGCHQKE